MAKRKDKFPNVNKDTPRQYGELGQHRWEKIILISALVIVFAIIILVGIFMEFGYLVVLIVFVIALAVVPMLIYVIRIPYHCVIEVHLTDDNMIDGVGIHWIPLHLIPEYDMVLEITKDRVSKNSIVNLEAEENVKGSKYFKLYPLDKREQEQQAANEALDDDQGEDEDDDDQVCPPCPDYDDEWIIDGGIY